MIYGNVIGFLLFIFFKYLVFSKFWGFRLKFVEIIFFMVTNLKVNYISIHTPLIINGEED